MFYKIGVNAPTKKVLSVPTFESFLRPIISTWKVTELFSEPRVLIIYIFFEK